MDYPKKGFDWESVLWFVGMVVVCIVVAIAGNEVANWVRGAAIQAGQKEAARDIVTDNRFKTVEYDGHRWVVFASSASPSFRHHPDCPCGQARKAERD